MTDEELNARFDTLVKMVAMTAALGRVLLENTGKSISQEAERLQETANSLIDLCECTAAASKDWK